MMNIFNVASNDQSAAYLAQIFGMVGNVLPVSKNSTIIIGMLFKGINTIALTIGALLVVYVTVIGLINTAHEGEFMGKKMNNPWVPLRIVTGIAALFPTASGYCAIQIVFMWIIMQGVGAADTLWTTALKYTNAVGSVYVPPTVQTIGLEQDMRALFAGLSCQASSLINQKGVNGIVFYCNDNPSASFCKGTSLDITPANNKGQVSVANGIITYAMGPPGGDGAACGFLKYTDPAPLCKAGTGYLDPTQKGPNSLACLAAKAQQSALQMIVSTFGGIANVFAQADAQYVDFYNNPDPNAKPPEWLSQYCSEKGITPCRHGILPPMPIPLPPIPGFGIPSDLSDKGLNPNNNVPSPGNASANTIKVIYAPYAVTPAVGGVDFIGAAVNMYQAALTQAAATAAMNMNSSINPADSGWIGEAQRNGWIMAGAYYYKLTQNNSKNLASASPPVTAKGCLAPLGYRNNCWASQDLIEAIQAAASSSGGGVSSEINLSSGPAEMSRVNKAISSGSASMLTSWMQNLSGNRSASTDSSTISSRTNPLANLANFGYTLMATAQGLYAAVLTALATISGIAIAASTTALGTGNSSVWGLISIFTTLLTPLFFAIIGSIYTIGATIGIYVPLIPYIVFIAGAMGWLLAAIEAMVAAPFVALGILSPSGHEIMGKAEHSLMLLFNLFLRPTLMIFGFIISIFLSIVVINLINAGFLVIVNGIISHPGLFEQILFMAAYTSLVVAALNKTFSVIYEIPNRVLTWIGGHPSHYGEGEMLQQVSRGIESAAGSVAKAGQDLGSSGIRVATGASDKQQGRHDARRARDDAKKDEEAKTNQASATASKKNEPPPGLG